MHGFFVQNLAKASDSLKLAMLKSPEDLGATSRGVPASMWQRLDIRKLTEEGFVRGAAYQDQWSLVSFRKPTGLFSNACQLRHQPNFYQGRPQLDDNLVYQGPPPARQAAGKGLIGKDSDGTFRAT